MKPLRMQRFFVVWVGGIKFALEISAFIFFSQLV